MRIQEFLQGKIKKLSRKEYKTYINSPEWRKKRKEYFSSKMYKTYPAGKVAGRFVCYCGCGEDNRLQLHHKTYKRLGNELISTDLVPVCQKCHQKIHKLQKESGMHLWGATKKQRKLEEKFQKSKTKRKQVVKEVTALVSKYQIKLKEIKI